ncbi:ornithine cyclodeaminase family protein [Williamsia sterculiae]|uniref:Ornithine cyclodeaminase/alanine dehydrogenase n=1 Tax=Williamsia sterculiae TaxID=1344003 RepID=A0A1N7H165_9NOCA|nr:ornithine cyclodeaminase family protein [Williamsia sterculiae]SIS18584.1 ornithine cyclodeaminase/alanine dehydrogenase [Williamsia sterculiae]
MTLVLRHSEVAALLDRDAVRVAVEQAHADLATGAARNPEPGSLPVGEDGEDGRVLTMVAALGDLACVKILSDLPCNSTRGLPRQRSTIVVTSTVTGECVAVLDGRAITAMRTAATSAVATAHLARPDAYILGLVGAGNLAIEHTRAIAATRTLTEVVVWSRSPKRVDEFQGALSDMAIPVWTAASVDDVAARADIICTLTPSVTPVLRGAALRPGTHLNVVGAAPRPGEREVDGAAMARSRIVVDSRATALAKSGDAVLAIAENAITADDVSVELGDVITGRRPGRRSADEITLFDSTGVGLQDLATAAIVVAAARGQGRGTPVSLNS